jgi:hypothetical protein
LRVVAERVEVLLEVNQVGVGWDEAGKVWAATEMVVQTAALRVVAERVEVLQEVNWEEGKQVGAGWDEAEKVWVRVREEVAMVKGVI